MDQNNFGGDWTYQKIEIISSYAEAYLTIMAKYRFKLIYFDGFAGSGEIETIDENVITGAAMRIMSIDQPRAFDIYYFVELVQKYATNLDNAISQVYSGRKEYHVVCTNFATKIDSMVNYLRKPENKYVRVLAFVDPKGMQVKWSSIERLKGLGIDMWILVPLGIGVNRMLKRDGDIPDEWVDTLETCLGMTKSEILKYFYQVPQPTLFGDFITKKHKKPVDLAASLYQEKLSKVFKHVSNPFVLRNSKRSPMYHFYLASNNKDAVKIANDVMSKYI